MIAFIIDVALIGIIALCAYRGFSNGVVRGVCGFLALILSVIMANAAATAFAPEFTDVIRPFVGGLVDREIQMILRPNDETEGSESARTPLPDEDEYDSSTTHGMSMLTLRKLGMFAPAAQKIADAIDAESSEVGYALSSTITEKLCRVLAQVAVFAIAFILFAIVCAIAGNLISFAFSLPGLRLLDQLAGIALGLLRGVLVVLFIATVVRYFGIITHGTIESTHILEYLVNHNVIANALGI